MHKVLALIIRHVAKTRQSPISPQFAEIMSDVLTEEYQQNIQKIMELLATCENSLLVKSPRRGSITTARSVTTHPKLAFSWYEILDTEKDYLDSLIILSDDFRSPMIQNKLATPEELQPIFSNLDALKKTHEHLLSKLSLIKESDLFKGTGHVFQEISSWLKVYTDYNPLYLTELNRLVAKKTELQEFLLYLQETPKFDGARIQDYLIKPIQRIGKFAKHSLGVNFKHKSSKISSFTVYQEF